MRVILLPVLALVIATPGARAQTGTTGDTTSRVVLEIPPSPGNPRNSEGAFIGIGPRKIAFIYSHFTGASSSDSASAYLAARFSGDDGDTWSATDTVILRPDTTAAMNVMSVSLLRMLNGDIGMFYLRRRNWHDMRLELVRSADNGHTWGPPTRCMSSPAYYVVNNDRVVRLRSGRLVVPAAMFQSISSDNYATAVDWRGHAVFFLSDDDGRSWRQSDTVATLAEPSTRVGLQEPAVVELADGELWALARTDQGRQYELLSPDGGRTWSVPRPSQFTSPVSPLSIKRLPHSSRLLAVWNPAATDLLSPRQFGWDRTPLVLALGDGPESQWTQPRMIEPREDRKVGYAYTAIHFTEDGVLLAYSAGTAADGGMLNRLRIRKLGHEYLAK